MVRPLLISFGFLLADSYYHAQYRRLAPRIRKRKALVAVAHSMLTAIWHMFTRDLDHHDLGADFFEKLNVRGQRTAYVRKLEKLGYEVTLKPAA